MIRCNSQCLSCDYPVHFDTYKGCSHACKYCFVKRKYSIDTVEPQNTTQSLKNFIEGKRNFETKWCDWAIPLHWGGNSDPFQKCELEYKCSLDCLKIFAETQYPFIVSTKNPGMLTQEPYFSLIQRCRCVLQVSMGCSKQDVLEPGAPTYEERLEAIRKLAGHVTRIIVRVRPYFPDMHRDILKEIPRWKEAGAYGISISSYISLTKHPGMERVGASYVFPVKKMAPRMKSIKRACHDNGLRFFCCESGLDHLSDEMTCCGTENLDGFIPNRYNIAHLAYDDPAPEPTAAMQAPDTYQPFKGIGQSQAWAMKCKGKTFAELMIEVGEPSIEWNKAMLEMYGDD